MVLELLLKIAKTHLLSRKKQSIIAALGVTFGIGMFIAMVGLMTGINKFLEDLMLANTAHVHIYSKEPNTRQSILDGYLSPDANFNVVTGTKPKAVKINIKNGTEILNEIKKDPGVEGASPLLVAQVFYNSRSTPLNGTISGVDIIDFDKLFNMQGKMEEGAIQDVLTVNNGIIMGKGLAENLNVNIHDQVNVTTYNGNQLRLNIIGIFSTGISAIDNVVSYASLNTAQKIMEKNEDYFTDINIKLKNIKDSPQMAKRWANEYNYKAEDWMQANAEVFVGFTMRNTITVAVSLALLIVAAFGIYNILTMMIYEKMNDIAILKANGFKGKDLKYLDLPDKVKSIE